MTNDIANASVAASLVQSDFQFYTVIVKGADGTPVRLFQATFGLPEGAKCTVTVYVGGVVLTSVAPIHILAEARRHEIFDFLSRRMPIVRLLPDSREKPIPPYVAWVEASAPMPTAGQPIDPQTTSMLVNMVVNAMTTILAQFPKEVTLEGVPTSVPLYASTKDEPLPVA